jgi:hypothetical protein
VLMPARALRPAPDVDFQKTSPFFPPVGIQVVLPLMLC